MGKLNWTKIERWLRLEQESNTQNQQTDNKSLKQQRPLNKSFREVSISYVPSSVEATQQEVFPQERTLKDSETVTIITALYPINHSRYYKGY